jgi:GT2 family glycosyltransferase
MKLDIVVLQSGQSWLTVRLLRSIAETTENYRVILVDNGSSAGDLRTAKCCLRDLDVLIENEVNRGFAKAVNQGLRVSDAPYVCIQNNDTVMYQRGYARMIAHLEPDPALGIIGPLTNNANSEQRVPSAAYVGSGYALASGLVAFFCVVIPRNVLETVGPLSEEYGLGYGEDDDYCIRLRRAGYKLGIALDVYVEHDHHVTYRALIGDAGIEELGRQGLEVLREKYGASV